MILEDKDLWSIVCGEEVEPADDGPAAASIPKFRKRARKAYATICLSFGDNQLSLVRSAQTAREAWQNWKVTMRQSPWQISYFYANSIFLLRCQKGIL